MNRSKKLSRSIAIIAIWIFPIFALLISGWLYYKKYSERGPVVQIHFNDASGVEADKTPLMFRGISVGKVESLRLTDDSAGVIVYARLSRDAQNLAVKGTQFWIVQPQVDFEGIRGLETIFRGSYIRVEKGNGEAQFKFQGLTGSVNDTTEGTVTYYLESPVVDSVGIGDTVSFRGLKVGSVSGIDLAPGARSIRVQINVEKKYVNLIRTNTVFWQKVGVDANLGLFGASIKIASLEALMRGGVAFATPTEAGKIANAKSQFKLNSSPPEAWEKWEPKL